jgi:hypothetical protein
MTAAETHEHAARPRIPPGGKSLVPTMMRINPSALERWLRCRRLYLTRDLLSVPASDPGPDAGEGLLVHALLKYVHEHGSCADPVHVQAAIDAHTVDDTGRLLGFINRHARRCPIGAHPLGHEREFARFHRFPGPIFMATGRIDALWHHGNMLEARDYKTGVPWLDRVGDDPVARLQAWLIAPFAAAEQLQIRIRYEHLAAEVDDDPDPYEPDAEQLADTEEELRLIIQAIRDERHFAGCAEPPVCSRCAYQSVCPDSARARPATWTAPPEPEPIDW